MIKKVNELLYTRIGGDWAHGDKDSFTKKEVDSIKNQIFIQREIDYCKMVPSGSIVPDNCAEVTIRKGDPKVSWYGRGRSDTGSFINFAIYKLKDEWYIVSWNGNYWKCDQIDGLISCISDNIVKPNMIKENTNTLISKIKRNLTPDLLKGMWKNDNPETSSTGHCYVATEALYWILGGPKSGYTPYVLSHKTWPHGLDKGETHWFLKHKISGKILDVTKDQFLGIKVEYDKGIPNGMMNYPVGGSKRAKILMNRIS